MTHSQNLLWKDIHAQADNLVRVIEHLYGSERARIEQAAAFLSNNRPTALIGMGSSFTLCLPAEYYLGERGYFASSMLATDALYTQLPALRHANAVINSRSGETAEIVRLAEELTSMGIPFVALTNAPSSPLAQRAAHAVWAHSLNDDLVSINAATAMMTAMLVLAAAVAGQMDAMRPHFQALAAEAGETIRHAWEAAPRMADLLGSARPIYLLSRGASKGAATAGRLVLEEAARWPAVALDAGDFRQGTIEVIDHRFGAVLLMGSGRQAQLNESLAENIVTSGGSVLSIGEEKDLHSARRMHFQLPSLPDALRPVLEVIPIQLLAYRLAEQQGYVPGQMRFISRVITTEEGLPKDASG